MALMAFPYSSVLDVTAYTLLGNNTGSAAAAQALTASQVRTLCSLYSTSEVDTLLSGKAAVVHAHAASAITSGTIDTARLASGTADATTYLRGDQTWATVTAGVGGNLGATANAVPRTDGTDGDTLQGSSVLIDDNGNVGIPNGRYLCWAIQNDAPDTRFSARASSVYSVFRAYSQDCFAISHYGYVNVRANAGYGFTNSTTNVAQHPDILLYRTDTSNLRVSQFAARNVPSAGLQVTHLEAYNTYTSSTSYERLEIGWDTNVATINTAAGSAGGTKQGLQICSAATDELGFFGATPVDQPATVADPSGGGTVDTEARAAIAAVIDRLQELGLIA